jgi:hypothetical protein
MSKSGRIHPSQPPLPQLLLVLCCQQPLKLNHRHINLAGNILVAPPRLDCTTPLQGRVLTSAATYLVILTTQTAVHVGDVGTHVDGCLNWETGLRRLASALEYGSNHGAVGASLLIQIASGNNLSSLVGETLLETMLASR